MGGGVGSGDERGRGKEGKRESGFSPHAGSIRETFWPGNDRARVSSAEVPLASRGHEKRCRIGTGDEGARWSEEELESSPT